MRSVRTTPETTDLHALLAAMALHVHANTVYYRLMMDLKRGAQDVAVPEVDPEEVGVGGVVVALRNGGGWRCRRGRVRVGIHLVLDVPRDLSRISIAAAAACCSGCCR